MTSKPVIRDYLAEAKHAAEPVRRLLLDVAAYTNYMRSVVSDMLPYFPKSDPRHVGFSEAAEGIEPAHAPMVPKRSLFDMAHDVIEEVHRQDMNGMRAECDGAYLRVAPLSEEPKRRHDQAAADISRDLEEWKRIADARNVVIGEMGQEIESLRAQVDAYDSSVASRDLGYEELRKRATRLIVAMRRDHWEGHDHGYTNELADLLNLGSYHRCAK